MKSVLALGLMMVSFMTFGAELGSVDAFLSVLPLGTHTGVTLKNESCTVAVYEVNFPEKQITVTAENDSNKIFKNIVDGSEYLFRAYKKEFMQSDRYYVDSSRISYVERVVRTLIVDKNSLYVVVANELNDNGHRSTESVECIVRLK